MKEIATFLLENSIPFYFSNHGKNGNDEWCISAPHLSTEHLEQTTEMAADEGLEMSVRGASGFCFSDPNADKDKTAAAPKKSAGPKKRGGK